MKIVEMRNIGKVFPDDTEALRGVDFSVREGEIHGLIGENGAGKTTLMRVLYGLIKPTEGRVIIKGNEVSFHDPSDAIKQGIGMVQQHFALVNYFTVTENIVLGSEPRKGVTLDRRHAQEVVRRISEQTGLDVDPKSRLEDLPIGVKQRVEILKMLYRGAKILILDEPTSVLSPTEVKDFFKTLKALKARCTTIIFVTHKLREVLEICDQITVLRQGKVTGVVDAKESTPQMLARMMVGRDVVFRLKKSKVKPGKPLLEVKDISVRNDKGIIAVRDLNFTIKAGEIFGVAGVEGNGQTELVEAVTGLRKIEKGKIRINGKEITKSSPAILRSLGVAHIPEDRDNGLIADLNVAENLILGFQSVEPFNTKFGMDFSVISNFTQKAIDSFNIMAPSGKTHIRYLSGGNQQRVIVARELSHKPNIIIAAQPTRGLDVASTEYVRSVLLKMREEGRGILMVTTDLDEAMQLSDRLAVMYGGSFMGVRKPEELTEEQIGLMMGGELTK